MAQVLKPEVRARILDAALDAFAAEGYGDTSMARIAAGAGMAVANLYRYYADKPALFDAVVPAALAAEHERLLVASAQAHDITSRVANNTGSSSISPAIAIRHMRASQSSTTPTTPHSHSGSP